MRRASRPGAVALAAFGVALGALATRLGPVIADGDRTRDALFARDCAELGRCALRAAPTTVPGVWQGGLWTGLVAVARAIDAPIEAAQAAVLASEAAAVALVAVALARARGIAAAAVGAGVLGALLLPLASARAFWNPSPLALPSAIAAIATARLAAEGGARLAAAAGFAAGVAASAHPVGLELAAGIAVAVAIAPRGRRAIAGGAAAMAMAVPLALTSGPAIVTALVAAAARPIAVAVAVAIAAAGVAFAAALGRRAPADARAEAASASTVLATVGACAAVAIGARHKLELYYAAPAFPALALALGARAGRRLEPLARPIVALAIAAALAFAVRAPPRLARPGAWRLADAPAVAAAALDADRTWGAVRFALEGPRCRAAAMLLSTVAPAPDPRASLAARALLLLRLPASEADRARAAGLVAVPLGGGAIAAIGPVASAIDRDAAEACFVGGVGPGGCVPMLPAASEALPPGRFLFQRRAYPEAFTHRHAGTFDLAVAWPLRPRAAPVRVDLADAPGRCPWSFARVEGAAALGELPARSVTIAPGEGGRLVVARRLEAGACDEERDEAAPPCVIESAPGDDALRAIAESAR